MVIVFVLNCGSSSVKYCLYKGGQEPEEVARGLIDRVGMADGKTAAAQTTAHRES